MNIPDVSGNRAHWDLVKAIKQLDSGYAAIVSTQITSNQASLPSIEDTLSAFAQHHRRTHIQRPNIHGGTFGATLQGEESLYKRKRGSKPDKPCLCGDNHFWGQCPYIDITLRTRGFVEDPAKVKKIAQYQANDNEGILNKICAKNRYFKKLRQQDDKVASQETDSDTIEIDAGDDPTADAYSTNP